MKKLNIILVKILKHEWPERWQNFIPDLVLAAKSNETICENFMVILKLLNEEVFYFSRGEMTQQKIKELKLSFFLRNFKLSLNGEFQLIYNLCLCVMGFPTNRAYVQHFLHCMLFLSWIPLELYI